MEVFFDFLRYLLTEHTVLIELLDLYFNLIVTLRDLIYLNDALFKANVGDWVPIHGLSRHHLLE